MHKGLKLGLALVGLLVIFGFPSAHASPSSVNISKSYHTDANVTYGDLVSLDPTKSGYVEQANPSNASRLLGIAVANNDSLLALNSSNNTTQVATSGAAGALVSTVNGNINVGDQISVSPFDGIGMKEGNGWRVVGLAQTSFNSSTPGAASRTITDKNGKTSKIWVGYVQLEIGVGEGNSTSGLNGLQKFVQSLTGHVVSTVRIVVSLVIAVVAILSLCLLIYASIYGSIIAIGRNPLAKVSIYRTLTQVLTMALAIALVAGVTVFLLLS